MFVIELLSTWHCSCGMASAVVPKVLRCPSVCCRWVCRSSTHAKSWTSPMDCYSHPQQMRMSSMTLYEFDFLGHWLLFHLFLSLWGNMLFDAVIGLRLGRETVIVNNTNMLEPQNSVQHSLLPSCLGPCDENHESGPPLSPPVLMS